ncbi:MAG: hypothetical protein K0S39_1677 [Paenibacillus sp.]|jgi:sugar phosphate isomerase/epimerase|nr:hypothetical protein [Paenibacillus sp.]
MNSSQVGTAKMRLGCRIFQIFKGDWVSAFNYASRHGLQSIQINAVHEDEVAILQEQMDRTGITISSVGAMSRKMLGPDLLQAMTDQEMVKRQIHMASRLGIPLVSQFAGNDPGKSFNENIEIFTKVFTPLVRLAEEKGVKLVFENCPLIEEPSFTVQNLAYSPAAWDAMFEAIPSPALGLEFDTGHPPILGIDIQRCISEYKDKIYHIHIKDCRILPEGEYKYGRIGSNYYQYEIPGRGDVNFHELIAALQKIGYAGDVTLDLRPTTFEAIEQSISYMKTILPSQ